MGGKTFGGIATVRVAEPVQFALITAVPVKLRGKIVPLKLARGGERPFKRTPNDDAIERESPPTFKVADCALSGSLCRWRAYWRRQDGHETESDDRER
jgi:hypothetical protein